MLDAATNRLTVEEVDKKFSVLVAVSVMSYKVLVLKE